MTSDKKTVSLLADLFVKKGLTDIVISPGSRNAPLIIAFGGNKDVNAYTVVDERSAAFFALGMAQQTEKPVAITCTSGSAVLNYAPAISEAYYQKIPLLVLTADRPPHMIDIGDGQTIRQENIFASYIKKSFTLPLNIESDNDFSKANHIINEAIDACLYPEPGPVHINIPLDEPIYGTTEKSREGKVENTAEPLSVIPEQLWKEFIESWNSGKKILILSGQANPSREMEVLLSEFAKMEQVVVMTETTSNLNDEHLIDCIDNVLTVIPEGEEAEYAPQLLITTGGAIVSKKIKKYLRDHKPEQHWHLSPSSEKVDTFFALSHLVSASPMDFLSSISEELKNIPGNFGKLWLKLKKRVTELRAEYLQKVPYSDLKVFELLLQNLPENSVLHLGNSTPVRYSQLFGSNKKFEYYSNRGVSGIDGQVSTAAGFALKSEKTNTIITGDLGFFYDSNALLNRHLKGNLKIIVINNGGGGIFRFIPGPDTTEQLEPFFEATHSWKAEKVAEAFDVKYFKAKNQNDLEKVLPEFYQDLSQPALLEVFTPGKENAKFLRDYFSFLKNSSH
ncbi:MAG: 2-succinyl-5-enolpyruvyl-6-hydroxy-3-cyclohexene-1-carboxylic-acid synthase [Bacteroidales bacterium]|nr:2-succinyl-5-enolpyruvyl-6-hydroxy-3-cyclohexene-1-carboxylic-acid synthase [Bacteroidales bacterium]